MSNTNWNELVQELKNAAPNLEIRTQEPMSRHTSFRVGGPAAVMALPRTEEEAVAAVKTAAKLGITPFFLGNGSNLLVPDEGVERYLIKLTPGLKECQVQGDQITADSGVTLARLAGFAKENGLSGLEFAHGIPGTLGGAVTMNAGAYGGEMAQIVTGVICLNQEGEVEEVTEFDFGYRHSAFSNGSRLILRVTMQLYPDAPETIAARMEELARQRQSKQPLEYPSAGSMFKRPAGHFAAALIDRCGLKGFTVGGAQVSEKHAGFVINRGEATCKDILELVEQVKKRVYDSTGVELEMEVRVLR